MDQLEPILKNNYDAIAYLEAGFIGYWGEWNRSTNGLRTNPQARRKILQKLLSVLPPQRMVALRYSYYKGDIFNQQRPLSESEAFNRSGRARTGAHNDCFLAGIDDWGTYSHTDPKIINQQKAFLNSDNRYLVQGGEVCNPSPYDDCPNAQKELAYMRWSTLNGFPSDGKSILADWSTQGCMDNIKRRLGYRFRLLNAEMSNKIATGEPFTLNLSVINEGWATAYNPRKLEIILRHKSTRRNYTLLTEENPQFWIPGQKTTINIIAKTPSTLPSGTYEVFLNLPDPSKKLSHRPEYSIRLANKGTWEEDTGFNSLQMNLIIRSK